MLTSRSFRLCVLGLDPIVNLANIDIDAPALGTLTPTLARSPLFMQMAAVARVARTWQEAEKLSDLTGGQSERSGTCLSVNLYGFIEWVATEGLGVRDRSGCTCYLAHIG